MTLSTTDPMPRPRRSRLSPPPTSWSLASPVAARGILDSYRSAQQQAAPPAPKITDGGLDDDDGDEGGEACPVGCVSEITRRSELEAALTAAEARGALSAASSSSSSPPLPPGIVVVDFYKKACGACK